VAEILLVRHAATRWSGRRYCGRTDLPLSAAGLAAARRLALELASAVPPGSLVVSSPLRRARQTAELLVDRLASASLRLDERWSETDFGVAEGLTWDELRAFAPQVAMRLLAGEVGVDWPGGERAGALAARVRAAFDDVVASGTPTIVVSHGGPLRIAIALAGGGDPGDVAPPEPGQVWRLPPGPVLRFAR
jgi:broad specificity phosphatase PhoE